MLSASAGQFEGARTLDKPSKHAAHRHASKPPAGKEADWSGQTHGENIGRTREGQMKTDNMMSGGEKIDGEEKGVDVECDGEVRAHVGGGAALRQTCV